MILVVGGIKGGGGKTTLATNLTVLRSRTHKVLLVDADEQRSASIWSSLRDSMQRTTLDFTTISLAGKSIFIQLERMRSDYDDIIVDVGGRDTTSQRGALAAADVFLVPFKPRSFDVWTLGDVRNIINEMKMCNPSLICYSIINQADSQGKDNSDAQHLLEECSEMQCLPFTIGTRKAFSNAASDGLSIIESSPCDKKAASEIQELYEFLYKT